MDAINLYISEYLENNNIDKAIELVKKYAELNNKIVNKKLLNLWTFKMPILVFIIFVFSYLIFPNIFDLSILYVPFNILL